jgi:plasmid stability protein
MPSVQIRVPQDVHRVLRRRAAGAGQSLEEYARTLLIKEARKPTLNEVLGRVGRRRGGRVPLAEAAKAVRDDRDPR